DSGLQTPKSDYVASVAYSPNRTYTFSTRARMDQATGSVQRFEAEGRASFDRWSVNVATNWVVTGAARWDLVANQINQYVIGAGYVDDCFVLAANYVTSYSYATT